MAPEHRLQEDGITLVPLLSLCHDDNHIIMTEVQFNHCDFNKAFIIDIESETENKDKTSVSQGITILSYFESFSKIRF